MLKWLGRGLMGLGALLVLAIVGVLILGHIDRRFSVTDWRVVFNALTGVGGPAVEASTLPQRFTLPEGLTVNVYARQLPKARLLHLTKAGDLLVSQPRLGQITRLLRDANADGEADGQEVLLAGLDRPHGMDIHAGWLYVGEGGAVGRVRFDEATGKVSGNYERILTGIPEGENHWTRTLRVGPDGWVYLSIGSSCNVCVEKHAWRAAMIRFRPDGSSPERYASGLRNSVGFDWAPWSGELYATDNGRDLLGDDFPPCELNRVVPDGFYGWPHLNGNNMPDPDLPDGDAALIARALPPAHGFGAHTAPLGIRFLRSPTLSARFGRAALVAQHGSWNRSVPDGYRLALLQWQPDGTIKESVFLSGFLRNGQVMGRPVDIAEAPDGQLFVSDDYAGVIYRIAPATSTKLALPGAMPPPAPTRGDPLAQVSADERAAASLAASALIKKHDCQSACHVPGSPLVAKWSSLRERYTLDELTAYFLTPTPPMPVFALSEAERRQLAIHLLANSPAQ